MLSLVCLLLPAVMGRANTALPFDDNWLFFRGDVTNGQAIDFPDSTWRVVDTPHDWSIEDLPPRADDHTQNILEVRNGIWGFQEGETYNEGQNKDVMIPADWRVHSNYTKPNAYGWYVKGVNLTASQVGQSLTLDLGTIAGADEAYFNDVKIGSTGSFPPNFEAYWSNCYTQPRTYTIPATLTTRADWNMLKVKVFSASGPGGLCDTGAPVYRSGPFDPGASPGTQSTGHTVGGVGWYRKHFARPECLADRYGGCPVFLEFDGVYMHSDVWVNGRHVGYHPYGYTAFNYEISSYLVAGVNQTIAVRVNNYGRNSRWYSGSGIIRHVWLTLMAGLYIPPNGVGITTSPLPGGQTNLTVVMTVVNASKIASQPAEFRIVGAEDIYDTYHSVIAVPYNTSATITKTFVVGAAAKKWSVEDPSSFFRIDIDLGDFLGYKYTEYFGIRYTSFSPTTGFQLNGVPIKLRGGCLHHDNGPLGAAAMDVADARRVRLMKAAGYNAIRTSHNPPSRGLMDAANLYGMLVIVEAFDCWSVGKNPDDYHIDFEDWWRRDIQSMVMSNRNHPSVIMWSIGNEIPERAEPKGILEAHQLADYVRQLDPTRPVTSAYPGVDNAADPYFAALDVAGYNYGWQRYGSDHSRVPSRIMVGTESFPTDSYALWQTVNRDPWVIGDFIWTAWDYIGESGIGHAQLSTAIDSYLLPWQWHISYCGDFDICGFEKPQSVFRKVLWGVRTMDFAVHRPLLPGQREVVSLWGWPDEERSWTWPGHEGSLAQVNVYSAHDTVKLWQDGALVGTQPVSALTARFNVTYRSGCLLARGYRAGTEMENQTLCTAGPPATLRLSTDSTWIAKSRSTIAYVTVEVLDAAGLFVPEARVPLVFILTGPCAELAAVASGDPLDVSSLRTTTRTTHRGRALALVRPVPTKCKVGGSVSLLVSSNGLASAEIVFDVM